MTKKLISPGSTFKMEYNKIEYKCLLYEHWHGLTRYAKVDVYKIVKMKFLFLKWEGIEYVETINLGRVSECDLISRRKDGYYYRNEYDLEKVKQKVRI